MDRMQLRLINSCIISVYSAFFCILTRNSGMQGSSQKKIKEGVVLRSNDICGFLTSKIFFASERWGVLPPSLARSPEWNCGVLHHTRT